MIGWGQIVYGAVLSALAADAAAAGAPVVVKEGP